MDSQLSPLGQAESDWPLPPLQVAAVSAASLHKHVNQFPNEPEEVRRTIIDAIDAWARITSGGKVDPADLQRVVAAVLHTSGLCWGPGGDLLGNLAGQYPESKDAVREIMRSGSATQRWHFLTAGLKSCIDDAFRNEILTAALSDRAPSVRTWAAEVCDILRLREMAPAIEARLAVEKVAKVRQALERKAALVRLGYHAQPSKRDPERWDLTVRVSNGWSRVSCTSEDVRADRLGEIAARVRSQNRG
jgi:hypothetical protein